MAGSFLFSVLGSSSGGNSVVVNEGDTTILIDAGLPVRYILNSLGSLGLDEKLDALFISHEHSDHIKSVRPIVKRYGCPVYLSKSVSWFINGDGKISTRALTDSVPVKVGSMEVTPFLVSHDALEPFGFVIKGEEGSLGIATDLGCFDDGIREILRGLGGLVVESNHDRDMLMKGPYPYPLKMRIMEDNGHLSNEQCADLLGSIIGPDTKEVVLAHLSEENNDPLLAYETALGVLKDSDHEVNLNLSYPRVPTPLVNVGRS